MKLTPLDKVENKYKYSEYPLSELELFDCIKEDRTNTHKAVVELLEGMKQYAETTPQVFASDNIKNALLRGRVESRNQTLTDLKQEIDNLFSV